MRLAEKVFRRVFLFSIYFLTSLVFPEAASSSVNQVDYRYVINVDVALKKLHPTLKKLKKNHAVYQLKTKIKGKVRKRTRVGFFKSRKKALVTLKKVQRKYRKAWLDTVKKHDKKYRQVWYSNRILMKSKTISVTSLRLSKKQMLRLMEKARKLMVKQDYPAAIKLYNKILSRGSNEFKQDAQEYLGVAREKNGQYAHAKAEYREYLRLYPDGEGAERVKMRLQSILTARKGPRRRMKKQRGNGKTIWATYGYVTEFYRYDKLKINDTASERSSVTTGFGLFARRRSDSSDIKLQMTGSHLYDLDDTEDNKERLTALYIDYANRPKTISMRLGRQRHTSSGVLGRMDGLWADYQFHPQWKINVVAGSPVNLINSSSYETNRTFYGLSLDIGPFNKYWDFNIFKIKQEVDGLTDREAVGGEIRYISPQSIFFVLVDYDTYFNEMNKIFVVSTWHFKGQKMLSVTYDKGKSPYMLTTNALQGQTFQTIEEMIGMYSEEKIRQLAFDRTAESTTTRISGTVPVSKKYLLNLDFTLSNLSGTPASPEGNVAATTSTGDEYFYGLQLIGSDVMVKGDTMIGGIRYSDSSTYKRTAFSISERLRFTKKWRSSMGLYIAQTNKTNGAVSETIRPSFGIDYLYTRSFRLEGDMSYDKTSTRGDTLSTEEQGIRLSLGFIYDF